MVSNRAFWALGAALSLSACASSTAANDPFEGFNRGVFAFNNAVDRAVLEPTAKGYRAVTNEPIRMGVSNFLDNLGEPVTLVNQVLQGDVVAATNTAGRFAVNTTVGIVGIFDVTGHYGWERVDEDFGQTLGVWGVGGGPYLMLPLFGPSNPRYAIGRGVDIVFNPRTWAEYDGEDAVNLSITGAGIVSTREELIETVEDLRTQVDPYTVVRRVYGQTRAAAIRNGEEDPDAYQNLPDYDDF